jgi:hypothetical protein
MTIVTLKPDVWAPVLVAPAGKLGFQNQTRGDVYFLAANALPTGLPNGYKYASKEGESDTTLAILFPAGGANLYAYSQLGGPVYANNA